MDFKQEEFWCLQRPLGHLSCTKGKQNQPKSLQRIQVLHHYIDTPNISKDGIKIERLSFQEVAKQELIQCKGPVAGTIHPGTEELVWDQTEGPRIAAREDQDKSHLATLLKGYHKFLGRRGAIIKTNKLTKKHNNTKPTACLLIYCL